MIDILKLGEMNAPQPKKVRDIAPPHIKSWGGMKKVEGALPPHLKSWGGHLPPCPPGSYAYAPIRSHFRCGQITLRNSRENVINSNLSELYM